MGLEAVTYINDLVTTNPDGTDPKSEGDNHIRNVKTAVKNVFPGMAGRAFRTQSKAAGYNIVVTDNLSTIKCTAALTLTLDAAATLGNGFMCMIQAEADVTIDPNGTEQINGSTTLAIKAGERGFLLCDGSNFFAFGFDDLVLSGQLIVHGAGPHAIGGAPQNNRQLFLTGTVVGDGISAPMAQRIATTITPGGAIDMYGLSVEPTFNEHSSGTHGSVIALSVGMTINAGAANVTDAVGLNILTFAAQATTTNASGLKIAAPTGATNNYALWAAGGTSLFNGTIVMNMAGPRVTLQGTAGTPATMGIGADDSIGWIATTTNHPLYLAAGNVKQVQVEYTASANRYITLTGSNGGNVAISSSAGGITVWPGTSDGSDSASVAIAGGGAVSSARGAYVEAHGNESASTGTLFLTAGNVANGIISLSSAGGEKARITAGGYVKSADDGAYIAGSSGGHEFSSSDNTGVFALYVRNKAATATNQFGVQISLTGDPNDASRTFFDCIGNVTSRIQGRSNGGLANFQANDANLCDISVKDGVYPAGSYLDFIRSIGIYEGRYKDDSTGKMHTMFVAQDIEKHDAGLITPWNDKGLKGVLEHDIMVRHVRATQELADRLERAEAALKQHGIMVH